MILLEVNDERLSSSELRKRVGKETVRRKRPRSNNPPDPRAGSLTDALLLFIACNNSQSQPIRLSANYPIHSMQFRDLMYHKLDHYKIIDKKDLSRFSEK